MSKNTLSLSETGQFPQLLIQYISGSKTLQPLYAHEPMLASFQKAITEIDLSEADRAVLVKALKQQYEKVDAPAAVTGNIDALAKQDTFTVTTGHQLCLFTGPLYFIYKIITTINLAETLSKTYPSARFVPMYWMASEDHDFAEVNHAHLFGKTLVWERDAKGAVGSLSTEGIEELIQQLEQMLANDAHGKELVDVLRDAYSNNNDLASATRSLVNRLFGEYGLVVIDPDHDELKKLFVPVLRDDILNGTNEQLVNGTISRMQEHGLDAQVTPRGVNVFYMRQNLRERIEREGDKFKVVNTDIVLTHEELEKELNEHPSRFSPNVVLRPLYQQRILPNLAYIGGPAEVVYWMEYKEMFDHHGISFPVLVPRNFVMLFDKGLNERMEKLKVTKAEIFTETEALVKTFVSRNSGDSLDISGEEEELKKLYEGLASKAEKIDPTLKGAVEAELQKQLNALKNIQGKLMRAEKQRQEASVNQLRKIKEKLFPGGALQERYDNFIPYYAKYGKGLIQLLKDNLDPLDFKMMLLDLE